MQPSDPLIRTKLHPPFIRAELAPRARLQSRFAQGLRGPLTLVTAPAGFGKTTFMTAGITGCLMPVAWLSLDNRDNQPGRFLKYLVQALINADSRLGDQAVQLLDASQEAPLEAVLASLINDLEAAGQEIVLVLDDYQFISSPAIHAAVAFLLEHAPKTFHLVIATRSDPPLPLARLRVRGQVVEFRAADLRFTPSEAAQFLNEIMGFTLSAAEVALLEERTEGWIAGLQMAALSMRDRDDLSGFIKGFSGTHRFILDYLLEEVLGGQSPAVQSFLLCTSILEHLSAPVCDAIMAGDDPPPLPGEIRPNQAFPHFHRSSPPVQPSASMLAYLEQANLFLVPLDDQRKWYRYHHLFADLLRAKLDQTHPGLAARLHGRASTWFEHAGLMVEAVNHALAGGENERAARLVEQHTTALLAKGELNALMGWIEALPAGLRQSRPWLCIHQAYALAFAGRLAEIEPLLATIDANPGLPAAHWGPDTPRPDTLPAPDKTAGSPALNTEESRTLAGAVNAIRAMAAVMAGRDVEAASLARLAQALLSPEKLWHRASAAWALGYALRSLGHLSEARAAFEEQIRLGRAMDNIWTLVTGLTDLAHTLLAQGRLGQARTIFEEALTEAARQGARSLGYIARMEAGLASVLYEQNQLAAAHGLLNDAIAHIHQWPNPHHLAYANVLQARVLIAQGDFQAARGFIDAAERVRESAALSRPIQRMVEANLVRLWLARQAPGGQLTHADPLGRQAAAFIAAWQTEAANPAHGLDASSETIILTLARVHLAAGDPEEALELLTPFSKNALAAGHIHAAIGALVLTALAAHRIPNPLSAFGALEEALSLAEPEGYVRIFLDEGQPMQHLLAQAAARSHSNRLQAYTFHLLASFDSAAHAEAPAASSLDEPLSRRELEVLHLIAQGMTNQEIAQQLIVSPGTIKAHTASIYRKLDVANRTEAVAHARQLGILP